MAYLTLYAASQLCVFSHWQTTGAATVLVLSSSFIGCLVGASRIVEYHHNPSDVVAGALVGTVSAAAGYFAYRPSLSSLLCRFPRFPDMTYKELCATKKLLFQVGQGDKEAQESSSSSSQHELDIGLEQQIQEATIMSVP